MREFFVNIFLVLIQVHVQLKPSNHFIQKAVKRFIIPVVLVETSIIIPYTLRWKLTQNEFRYIKQIENHIPLHTPSLVLTLNAHKGVHYRPKMI